MLTASDEQELGQIDRANGQTGITTAAAVKGGRKNRKDQARLITPAFLLAWIVNFCQYLVFYVLVTTMALYAVKQFAASDAASGLASSAFVVGATFAQSFRATSLTGSVNVRFCSCPWSSW